MNLVFEQLKDLTDINITCPLFVPHYFSNNKFLKIQQNKKPLKSAFLIIFITKICKKSL